MSQVTYDIAIANLNTLIPELFSAPGRPRRKFSLDEIGTLSAALGSPHRKFRSVLIAGTNGKGSTASTLASIVRESGLRVGLYTSPHLDRVNERIKLLAPDRPIETGERSGGIFDIPDDDFARLYFRVHDMGQQLVLDGKLPALPSYFELLTAVAFLYFAEPVPGSGPVDLAVLEVGMGGRLDATNLVDPLLSVITDISLDHQEWLGATIDLIAREKAGILRRDGTLVTLPQHPLANQALGEVAMELNVRGVNAAEYVPTLDASATGPYPLQVLGEPVTVDSPLHGSHQHRNLALAIASAVELAQHHGLPITAAAIERGIHSTRWPGRLERIAVPGQAATLLDVAHNPAGAWALRAALNAMDAEAEVSDSGTARSAKVLIFACLRDKPLREMTQILFPIFDHVVLAPIQSPRATEVADLAAAAEATGVPFSPAATVAEAIEAARRLAGASGSIVVSGSVYLVGEMRSLLLSEQPKGSEP